MLNTNIDPLLKNTIPVYRNTLMIITTLGSHHGDNTDLPDRFVDYHTNSTFSDIEHSASLPVVELKWHSFLKSTITLQARNKSFTLTGE